MAHVTLRELTKQFEDTVAVADLDLEIGDGEFVVLVGPSGSGKTTALRLVAGLERPTRGSIRIGDRDVTEVPPRDRDIAMVFQNYALYPHMSVYENMAFGLQVRRFRKRDIDARVREAADILGITNLLGRKPGQLSGGQRQRTALGRSIVRQPEVFLFDEPLSNLDAGLRVGMRAELSQLHRRLQATILYVTHDQVEAMTMGERIAIMNEGRLQQCAEPLEVYRRPANRFVASFIGSPAMNFFSGTLEEADGRWLFKGESFQLALNAAGRPATAEATLGVRPEDLALGDHGAFSALVRVVEPIGSEKYVHLETPDRARVVARVTADRSVAVDERVCVDIPAARAHLFREDTGERIGP
ncbi:MAG: ABC transporter ATP-binding protein [Gemmatimonadetes bacterium]|uniref:ABC transporter ATP-binding protein n=1 Tax=Candidatus Kutchimonas denitrificans TaxID=3056748 RepID=A0AAE4Z8Z9_9BACT|nr:ABC transporter ATP-binding protein [Gemmatimonadota bacterium]NIR74832.1 ABC transporter ATP-binding protein [Candidatus Kutchimonas denitrificans]NIR99943.1 ABC transporter ATP-binding protein [Gemmatimonadota bacterium]NIT65527.1 ABC transporter ATP-binding protein [Gemmatimonadota bacterium]NIU52497.1 sn-glycerol-3-phosphate ABC transporter ATP-binding protein UgpC [Gemmatimonadota bacterium]